MKSFIPISSKVMFLFFISMIPLRGKGKKKKVRRRKKREKENCKPDIQVQLGDGVISTTNNNHQQESHNEQPHYSQVISKKREEKKTQNEIKSKPFLSEPIQCVALKAPRKKRKEKIAATGNRTQASGATILHSAD